MIELVVVSILTGIGLGSLAMYIREVDRRLQALMNILLNEGGKDENN